MAKGKRLSIYKVTQDNMEPFLTQRVSDLRIIGKGCPDDVRVLGVNFQPFDQWYEIKATSARFAIVPEATRIPVRDEFVRIALADPHAISNGSQNE